MKIETEAQISRHDILLKKVPDCWRHKVGVGDLLIVLLYLMERWRIAVVVYSLVENIPESRFALSHSLTEYQLWYFGAT